MFHVMADAPCPNRRQPPSITSRPGDSLQANASLQQVGSPPLAHAQCRGGFEDAMLRLCGHCGGCARLLKVFSAAGACVSPDWESIATPHAHGFFHMLSLLAIFTSAEPDLLGPLTSRDLRLTIALKPTLHFSSSLANPPVGCAGHTALWPRYR